MTVAELIEYLQTQPQHLQVIQRLYSEYSLFDADEMSVETHCQPRPDGWVHNYREDKPKQQYLVIPGN